MPIEIRMPKLSDNMEEGTIIRWLKNPGDYVQQGEPLAEVETDKADVEFEASDSGTLHEIRVAQGASAAVGDVIAVLKEGGAPRRADARPGRSEGSVHDQQRAEGKPGEAGSRADELEKSAAAVESSARALAAAPQTMSAGTANDVDRRVQASPLAWRLAEEMNVNLATLTGSGPGGRILKRDVDAAASVDRVTAVASPRGKRPAAGEPQPAAATSTRRGRVEEPTRMRRMIARRMAEAKHEIPHFYISVEIDMSEAMRLRNSVKQRKSIPGLTVTHLLVKALALASLRHPRVNGSWRDDGVEFHHDVNVGIAVAVEDGLVVPVLHQAQQLSLTEIAARANALTEKARGGRFGSDDLSGGTISLSNVGMLDVEDLVAIINPPQAAILAVGTVKDRPVVRDGEVTVAQTLRATLSCDHRVLNGIEAGRFLEELKGILEHPVALVLE